MSKRTIIYRNVAARMALLGIKKTELAKLLDMNYSTLQGKLRGRSSFSLEEAIEIKDILCSGAGGFFCPPGGRLPAPAQSGENLCQQQTNGLKTSCAPRRI